MYLNSQQSNFIINFTKGWIYPEIEEKYSFYLRRLPIPYGTLTTFINSTIQGCSFPELQFEDVTQNRYNSKTPVRPGYEADFYFTREITINFKTTESFINYFAMYDQLMTYMSFDNPEEQLPQIVLHLLDHSGFLLVSFYMTGVVFQGITNLELSYSSDHPEFRTFSCRFRYADMKIRNYLTQN